jgi:TolB-like protein
MPSQTSQNSSRGYYLDSNIRLCGNDISTRIASGTSIAVVNIETHEKRLSDFIINELINVIVNKETLRVVTRQRIDELQSELNFNMSGFVSDDTAQSIGKMIGSEIIVIGSITPIGNVYRLNIQTLKTETGEILRAYGYDITYDDRIKGLIDIVNNTPIEIRGNEMINRNSHNFIQLREYARFLIGGQYYVCLGRCNLYTVWSNRNTGVITYREATGKTNITYVAVHVNPKTGEVLNIVTVNKIGREVPTTDELIGGFSVDEYFRTNTWMEAIRYIQQNDI